MTDGELQRIKKATVVGLLEAMASNTTMASLLCDFQTLRGVCSGRLVGQPAPTTTLLLPLLLPLHHHFGSGVGAGGGWRRQETTASYSQSRRGWRPSQRRMYSAWRRRCSTRATASRVWSGGVHRRLWCAAREKTIQVVYQSVHAATLEPQPIVPTDPALARVRAVRV